MKITTIKLEAPYLVFLGDVGSDLDAKTGLGIAWWRAERCAGQMRFAGCPVDCGLPDLSVAAALSAGVRTVIIGVAPTGGRIRASWLPPLIEFATAGVNIASGLHHKLGDFPQLVAAAREGGADLIDVRTPPSGLPCGLGKKRSGKRVLTVGTDCVVGKKYSALALHVELSRRGIDATFRATGQTGIMIAGEGIAIDAVPADFIAGAAEVLSPDNRPDHWDVIEGQGSLFHPSYAGVTLGLLHGSQPDALVLCHDASRREILDVADHYPIPPLEDFIDRVLAAARVTNPHCEFAGISVNTTTLNDADRSAYLANLEQRYKLPAVDPVATGMRRIADYLLRSRGSSRSAT